MVADEMVDEYYERYRRQTHEELFRQLMAGLPAQADTVAASWRKAENAIESLAVGLRADLERLASRWSGTGSREYQYRLGLVVAYAGKLAEEAAAMRTGLAVMSGSLAEAQRRAAPDQPEPPVDAAATAFGGLTALGRTLPEEERAKARERVAVIVARLAAEYAVADHRSWPASMPVEPPGMPAGVGTIDPVLAKTEPTAPPTREDGATELAGDGVFGPAPAGASAAVTGLSPASPPPPVSSLVGAGPVLGGGTRHVVAQGAHGGGQSTATGAPPMGGMPPPMAGGVIGGRSSDGYAITDPRVADGSTAWSGDDKADRSRDLDAPPAILGGTS